jgi:CRP-like cAMP-binding protein
MDNATRDSDPERLLLASATNWIAGLPAHIQADMRARMSVRVFEPGEVISSAGATAEYMHQVVSGTLKMTAQHSSGEESLLAFYVPGSCWAETAIVADRPLNHTTIAMTAASVASLPQADFWLLYRRYPEIPEALCRKFARSLSRMVRNRELRETLPLRQLVLMALQNLADMSSTTTDGVWRAISIPLTQSDIAACFGVTRQSIQTVVSQLKAEGIIDRRERVWFVACGSQ